ncbi:MAG: hypothetical protein CL920_24910 [Deltaproteobacteria bacterium]|nr:hypothetical protein [Deltaproteobacteria bacterium]|tara:strand:+ start:630 stop:3314 length:2685 start_codon:yes stop_codon:yes gene_type:complete
MPKIGQSSSSVSNDKARQEEARRQREAQERQAREAAEARAREKIQEQAKELAQSKKASAQLKDVREQRVQEFAETGKKPSFVGSMAGNLHQHRLNRSLDVQRPPERPAVTHDPGTLAQESTTDANVNCIDQANTAVQQMSPEERAQSEVVFLQDTTNADGNDAGHVMVQQPDGALFDPATQQTTTWEALQSEGRYEPVTQDGETYTMPAEQFSEIMSQPPGQRDLTGIPQEVANMRLADTEVTAPTTEDPSTAVPDLEVVDLSSGIDIEGLGQTIETLTNERGENARLGFHIEGAANINGGPVQVGAWGDLGIQVSQADTGATVLSFDAEVAAKAGIDLGIFEVEVAAGGTYRASARFANSQDAARWIGQQLEGVNEAVPGEPFNVVGPDGGPADLTLSRPPTIATQAGVLGQASVTVDASDIPGLPDGLNVEGSFSVRGDGVSTSFQVPDGEGGYRTHEGYERSTTYEAAVTVGRFQGSFTRTNSEIGGDPTIDNNGIYRNDQYSFTVTAADMEDTPAMENAVAGLLGFDGPPPVGSPARGMFDDAMGLMADEGFREQVGVRGSMTVTYERNYTQEANGEMELQYGRLRLNTGVSANFESEVAGVGEIEVSASASHSEVLFEHIGTQTESYARGVALRSSEEDWSQFATQNADELGTMIENGAGSEQAQQLGLPDPATVYREQGPEAGIAALADVWRAEDTRYAENEGIINRAADDFESGGADAQLRALEDVASDPQRLADTLDELARRGYTDREIRDMLDSNAIGRFFSSAGENRAASFDDLQAQAAPYRDFADTAAQDIADSLHYNLVERGFDDYMTHGAAGQMLSDFAQTASPEQLQQVVSQLNAMGVTPEQLQQMADQAVQEYGTSHHGQHAHGFQDGVNAFLVAAGAV